MTYTLEGKDSASFTINAGTGVIQTKSSLNHEDSDCGYDPAAQTTACTYSVRVRASDGTDGGSAYHSLTINVVDVDEPPVPPAAPRVTATANSGWSLDVTWNEPTGQAGKPPITDYDIHYREFGATDDAGWQLWSHGDDSATDDTGDTKRTAKITRIAPADDAAHLEPGTEYEVQVRATNAEGTSAWSSIGKGTTGAGNIRPVFDNTDSVVTLSVDENTPAGRDIGSAVSATDADSNRLTYSMEGPGAASLHHRLPQRTDKDEVSAGP